MEYKQNYIDQPQCFSSFSGNRCVKSVFLLIYAITNKWWIKMISDKIKL